MQHGCFPTPLCAVCTFAAELADKVTVRPADIDDEYAGGGGQQHPGQADGQAGQQAGLLRTEHRLEVTGEC
jgi:hypothetical protein